MKANWKIKFSFFAGSLFLSLLILELGLRVAGFYMTSTREADLVSVQEKEHLLKQVNENRLNLENTDNYFGMVDFIEKGKYGDYRDEHVFVRKKIRHQYNMVTFGDSTTNGGNVPIKLSWPFIFYNLQKEKNDFKYKVYNAAICEHNTYNTLNLIKRRFNELKPDVVVLLTGEADRFNPIGLLEDDSNHEVYEKLTYKLKSAIHQLRIYKIFRGIYLNLKLKKETEAFEMYEGTSRLETNLRNYEIFKNVWTHVKKDQLDEANKLLATVNPKIPEGLFFKDRRRSKESRMFDIIEFTVLAISDYYLLKYEYESIVKFSLKAMVDFPFLLTEGDEEDEVLYSLLIGYDFQSRYDADWVTNELEKIKKPVYEYVVNSRRYKYIYDLFKNEQKNLKLIRDNRLKNLREIVEFLLERDVKVVLQNYPADFTDANIALEQVAKEYKLPFVDNRSVFIDLIKNSKKVDWLEDDEHPSPKGYEVMAKNVYEVLKKQNW